MSASNITEGKANSIAQSAGQQPGGTCRRQALLRAGIHL